MASDTPYRHVHPGDEPFAVVQTRDQRISASKRADLEATASLVAVPVFKTVWSLAEGWGVRFPFASAPALWATQGGGVSAPWQA